MFHRLAAAAAIANGDPMFCGQPATDCSSATTYRRAEKPFYGRAAQLEAYVLPGYGHVLNYAPAAPELHSAVVSWADRKVGR